MAEKVLCCAVYTRKSTEDGLEQEFNSLDAQYAAFSAFALSQPHEDWRFNPQRYDDGGFSGGSMERPGLRRFLADVEAGNVDIILLYKIDRLTRNLADFAKIVEVLDKAGASFVSITQSFNTTTSMGRLTLNMLLSFAQFEREVTGERIRDKIAASKRRGIWMGGPVPLGYDVRDHRLVANAFEAELVRHIMRRYVQLSSVAELVDELDRDGHRTKLQVNASGPHRGSCVFRRGMLYHLLANPIYLGKLTHKGEVFEGEHEGIVPEELWDEVQAVLKNRARGTSRRLKAAYPGLLVGKLSDGEGRAMTTNHACKPGVRYRYYNTRPDQLDGTPAWRVSAHDLEQIVCTRVGEFAADPSVIGTPLCDARDDALLVHRVIEAGDILAVRLRSGSQTTKSELIARIVAAVTLREDRVDIALNAQGVREALGVADDCQRFVAALDLTCPAIQVRRGHQLRLIIPAPATEPAPTRDEKLVSLVAEAHAGARLMHEMPGQSIATIAKAKGRCRTRLARLIALSCLAPDIVTAIVEGRQPPSLTAKLLLECELPLAWTEQRTVLGFS